MICRPQVKTTLKFNMSNIVLIGTYELILNKTHDSKAFMWHVRMFFI